MSCIMKKIYDLLICVSLFLSFTCVCVYGFNNSVKCLDTERQALLEFKDGLEDEHGILSSWDDNKDCCSWWGVQCNNTTGHVISLDLHGNYKYLPRGFFNYNYSSGLRGEVSVSVLITLKHLRYLDLSNNDFSPSQMEEAIGSFHGLNHLNLSGCNFGGAIPHQLGNLSNLQSLHLGSNHFTGEVPHQLGNLSGNLHTLDLGCNPNLTTSNLVWLSQLHLLRYLDLAEVNLMNTTNWERVIFNLPFLEELYLRLCQLRSHVTGSSLASPHLLTNSTSNSLSIIDLSNNHLTSLPHWLFFNMSNKKLVSIDISYNGFEGPIPDDAFGKMFSLQDINMSGNYLTGGIPKSFQNLSHLRSLQLMYNYLSEPIPEFLQKLSKDADNSLQVLNLYENRFYGPFTGITRFSSLRELWLGNNPLNVSLTSSLVLPPSLEGLDLSSSQIAGNLSIECSPKCSSLTDLELGNNSFTGSLPVNIGEFSKLQTLVVSSNLLDGTISELHFSNLSNLEYLSLSFNSLVLNISPNWMPPFQLESMGLANCSVGPHFPHWLRTQSSLTSLDLESNAISETIPNWFWNFSLPLFNIDLSHNQISGSLPELSPHFDGVSVIDLSYNNFSGVISSVPYNLSALFLHKNKFMGPISFLCAINSLHVASLDLSDNLFSGEIPNCWMNMTQLSVFDLANNRLSGPITESLGFLGSVVTLNLRDNHFVGEIPSSIRNCSKLQFFDVGGNNLTGIIPSWMGITLTSLVFLSLRSNNFNGSVPQNICHLSYIQVLDLSHNNLFGEIPNCFNNFTSLVQQNTLPIDTRPHILVYNGSNIYFGGPGFYMDTMWVQWKRYEAEYGKILGQLKVIDLSDNKLVGEIPAEIASLEGLRSLNLSVNNLTGNIISHIDQMEMLEILDLSRNQLSGKIPPGLAQLYSLDVLDLSYNNLSGRIPSGAQLRTFDSSSYTGNNGLCGFPLEKCPGDEIDSVPTNDHGKDDNSEDEDGFMNKEEYMVAGLGFLVGLGGVVVVLCKGSWRDAYFRLLEDAYDWFYVRIVVYWLRLKRMLISR